MKTKKEIIKQRIIAVTVAFFMLFMVFGSIEVKNSSAADDTTNLVQNFIAGTLQIEASGTAAFNNITIGVAANSLSSLAIVNARDYTGSGAGWDITGAMNNMLTSGAGANEVSNAVIAWNPIGTADLIGLESASESSMTLGAAGYFSGARTLITAAAGYGIGNYRINGTELNVVYDGSVKVVGTYQNTLTLTISSD